MITLKMYGDQALLINFEQKIDEDINTRVIELNQAIEKEKLLGFRYSIPAYCSLTIAYDPTQTSFEQMEIEIQRIFSRISYAEKPHQGRNLLIPVCYEGDYALDFEEVERQTRLSRTEVIQLHTGTEFRVFMLGFMPGFTYMGKLPQALYCSRRQSPRLRVPKGSVGLASFQTGIYPSELPGGWQIIGRTPLPLFNPHAENPFLFQAGDTVHFSAISASAYEDLEKNVSEGSWEYTQMLR